MTTPFYSQDGRLVFNTKEYADWPQPGTPEWDNLDVKVTNLSSDKPIGISLSGDGVLTFTATDPKDSFKVEFSLQTPSAQRTPRAPEQRSRSMRLKDKNRQRAKAKMAKVSRKRNRA